MPSLVIKDVSEQPAGDNLVLFPDYVIGRILRAGPSLVEADASAGFGECVEFTLRHRSGDLEVIASVPTRGEFRAIMARFAVFCQLPNIYCGHVIFDCDYEREGRIRKHTFSLFHCNEPAMGIWLKLYLYSIERLWPFKQNDS